MLTLKVLYQYKKMYWRWLVT